MFSIIHASFLFISMDNWSMLYKFSWQKIYSEGLVMWDRLLLWQVWQQVIVLVKFTFNLWTQSIVSVFIFLHWKNFICWRNTLDLWKWK